MAITWGTVVYGNGEEKRSGKIGIEIDAVVSPTKVDFTVSTYFASKYGVTDSSNTYYFDPNASSATTAHGSKPINHTNNSGSGWTGNQTHLKTHTYSHPRTTGAQTINFSAKISGVDYVKATPTVTVSYTVPALEKYSVSYHANDFPISNSLPATQYKYYGETIYVASESQRPITPGYYCVRWSTARPDSMPYEFGSPYTANASAILYACWLPYTYTISYDANAGTDSVSNLPASQTVEYNSPVTLSGRPVRENYDFLGWSTSPSATAAYESGTSYDDWATACVSQNETITLYAVWELAYAPPKIDKVVVERADSSGELTDEGTHLSISFEWSTDKNFVNKDGTTGATGTRIVIRAEDSNGSPALLGIADDGSFKPAFEKDISGFTGTFNELVGPPGADGIGPISTELSYTVHIEVFDTNGRAPIQRSIMHVAYPIDVKAGGKGVAFGGPAAKEGVAEFKFDVEFSKGMIFGEEARICLLNFFYPVGSIYMSFREDNPSGLFGGTWERIERRFLYGAEAPDASGDSDIGRTGGADRVVLTVDQIPAHSHQEIYYKDDASSKQLTLDSGNAGYRIAWTANAGNGGASQLITGVAGGGQAHENMPPFVAVAIWQRIA